MQDLDIEAVLAELGGNIEGVARQLMRKRRTYSLNELESLRQTLLSNAGTIEAIIRIQKHDMGESLAEIT
jgi:predicted amino acid-binding ACT domain protein